MRILCLLIGLIWGIGQIQTATADTYIESQQRKQQSVPEVKWRGCGFHGSHPLKIATFTTNPPFGWTEETGTDKGKIYTAKGFGIDFIRRLTDELHITTQSVGFQSDRQALMALMSGDVDILVGKYYDPKIRMAGQSYLIPSFFQNQISAVFLTDKERTLTKLEDLIGLKGVVRQDEGFYPYIFPQLPAEITIEQVIDSRTAFSKLLTGEADYMLASPYSAEAEARRFKVNHLIKSVALPIAGQELFLVYSGRSACPQYFREINALLKQRKPNMTDASRELFRYMNDWGDRFRDQPPLTDQLIDLTRQKISDQQAQKENTEQVQ